MSQTQGAPGSRISGSRTLAKRPPGRPKGTPKTGGAVKGKIEENREARERIMRQADPIGLLIQVCAGRVIETYDPISKRKVKDRPSLEQRIDAASKLTRKILPDLASIEAEIGAKDGAPLFSFLAQITEEVEREERDVTPNGKAIDAQPNGAALPADDALVRLRDAGLSPAGEEAAPAPVEPAPTPDGASEPEAASRQAVPDLDEQRRLLKRWQALDKRVQAGDRTQDTVDERDRAAASWRAIEDLRGREQVAEDVSLELAALLEQENGE